MSKPVQISCVWEIGLVNGARYQSPPWDTTEDDAAKKLVKVRMFTPTELLFFKVYDPEATTRHPVVLVFPRASMLYLKLIRQEA